MANSDWNPEDLLDFNYDHEVPGHNKNDEFEAFDKLMEKWSSQIPEDDGGVLNLREERRRYEEMRHQSDSSAEYFGAPDFIHSSERSLRGFFDEKKEKKDDIFEQFDRLRKNEGGAPAGEMADITPDVTYEAKEIAAIKKASRDANDRYRSNYDRIRKKKDARTVGAGKAQKWLTGIYIAALAVFVLSMTVMNVLPFGMMVALYSVLALLSILILLQMYKNEFKRWARTLATALAVVLIFFYGVGTAYAMGTLSFLSTTSVENENSVENITKDPFNVVITGMDVRGTVDKEGRSDVNMILTVNPRTAQVLMTSIPRDYQVYLPDKDNAMDKLTHTGFYSVQTTILSEEDLLGISANYYVKVNFTTVEKFIDAIGGVDVYSEYEFNPVKLKEWTVMKGLNHMTGEQALAFARERKAFVTGDHQRIKNQQAVFEAMFKKATSSRTMILSYNKIITNLKDFFEMSFSSKELRKLAKMQLAKDPEWRIYKNTIVGGDDTLPTYTTGASRCYVMTQDEESINNAKTLINAVMSGQDLVKDEDGNVSVPVTEGE